MSRRQRDLRTDRPSETGESRHATGIHDTPSEVESLTVSNRSRSPSPACFERSALSISGIALLSATKFADALTTGIGLRYVPAVYEANPIADLAFRRFGLADGLLWGSFVVIVTITLLTEIAAISVAARRPDGHLAPVVRIVGYGIPALAFAAVSVHNVSVIVAGIDAGSLGIV